MSSVDSAFGLTEEQRLAKEEEERNVALVEIQLRDEHSFPALGVSLKYTVNVVRKTVYLHDVSSLDVETPVVTATLTYFLHQTG